MWINLRTWRRKYESGNHNPITHQSVHPRLTNYFWIFIDLFMRKSTFFFQSVSLLIYLNTWPTKIPKLLWLSRTRILKKYNRHWPSCWRAVFGIQSRIARTRIRTGVNALFFFSPPISAIGTIIFHSITWSKFGNMVTPNGDMEIHSAKKPHRQAIIKGEKEHTHTI